MNKELLNEEKEVDTPAEGRRAKRAYGRKAQRRLPALGSLNRSDGGQEVAGSIHGFRNHLCSMQFRR